MKQLSGYEDMPHNGDYLMGILYQAGITGAELARRTHVHHTTATDYRRSLSLPMHVWWRASKVLGVNLIAHFARNFPVEYNLETDEVKATMQEEFDKKMAVWQTEIDLLRRENEVLRYALETLGTKKK